MSRASTANFSDNLSTLSYESKQCLPSWIYDKKSKTIFGRTGTSWILITLFYMVYYTLLAGFFVGMLFIFLTLVVPSDKPLRTGLHSLLKFTPGLGLRPNIDSLKTVIHYSKNDPQTYETYVQNLDAYLNAYYSLDSKPAEAFATCSDNKKDPKDIDVICRFPVADLGPCSKDNKYGYTTSKPCVFIKINKIYGWIPKIIDKAVPHPLVKCEGQNPLDKPGMGELKYYPQVTVNGTNYGKYDNTYFPYIGQAGYVNPVVAIKFESIRPNVAVLVECSLYNIETDITVTKLKFEIMVD